MREALRALAHVLAIAWRTITDPPGVWFAGGLTYVVVIRTVWLAQEGNPHAMRLLLEGGDKLAALYLTPLGLWMGLRTVKRLRAEKRLEREGGKT